MIFYKEAEFQDSPIGRIPKSWEVGDASLLNVLKGFPFSSDFFNGKKEGMPLIRIRDLGKTETESRYSGPYDSAYLIKRQDILVSMDGEFNVYLWNAQEGLLNQRVCKVSSKDTAKLDDLFLYYELHKPLKIIESKIGQTTVKHLLDRNLETLKFPLPPLKEQRSVVGVLGVVDSAIELADKVIAKTERLKKGLMQKLLTEGTGHKEFKDTEIGKIPKTWEVKDIKDVAEVANGHVFPPKYQGRKELRYLYAKVNDFNLPNNQKYIKETANTINNEDQSKLNVRIYPSGTIVFPERGAAIYLNRKRILARDGAFDNNLMGIMPKNDFIKDEFIFYYFVEKVNLTNLSSATTTPLITKGTVEKLKLAIPQLEERRKIAATLSCIDERLNIERKQKTKLERIKHGLTDLLLTGKIRVKVD